MAQLACASLCLRASAFFWSVFLYLSAFHEFLYESRASPFSRIVFIDCVWKRTVGNCTDSRHMLTGFLNVESFRAVSLLLLTLFEWSFLGRHFLTLRDDVSTYCPRPSPTCIEWLCWELPYIAERGVFRAVRNTLPCVTCDLDRFQRTNVVQFRFTLTPLQGQYSISMLAMTAYHTWVFPKMSLNCENLQAFQRPRKLYWNIKEICKKLILNF